MYDEVENQVWSNECEEDPVVLECDYEVMVVVVNDCAVIEIKDVHHEEMEDDVQRKEIELFVEEHAVMEAFPKHMVEVLRDEEQEDDFHYYCEEEHVENLHVEGYARVLVVVEDEEVLVKLN